MPAATREKLSRALKKAYADPERRAAVGKRSKAHWAKAENRERLSKTLREAFKEHPEFGERITKAHVERFRREVAERQAEPDTKRCGACGETKPIAAFAVKREKLKSGYIAVRPVSYCNPCNSARVKAKRDKEIAEGVDVSAREREKKRRRAADPQKREMDRRYQREWATNKRRQEGRKNNGGWHRYRRRETYSFLPVGPIAVFLEERIGKEGISRIARATGVPERRLHGIRHREQATVRLSSVDAILSGLGCPELMHELYPDTSVGYHLLNEDGEKV